MPSFEQNTLLASPPLSASDKRRPRSSTDAWLQQIEEAFTDEERAFIDGFFDRCAFTDDGSLQDEQKVMESIFCLRDNHEMARIEKKLEAVVHFRLRDYLATRADALFHPRHSAKLRAVSGVFEIPKALVVQKKHPVESRRPLPTACSQKEEKDESWQEEPLSSMRVEALRSKAVIGQLYPSTRCQANYRFGLPTLEGMRCPPLEDPYMSVSRRAIRQMDEGDLESTDVVIELPVSRIFDGVLPVPAKYEVVGSLDQPLDIQDPHGDNPFCTRMLNTCDMPVLRYIVRKKVDRTPVSVNQERFAPTEKEMQDVRDALPLCHEDRQKGFVGVHAAVRMLSKHMGSQFLYVCDDRLGAFISRHPNELGTIIDGLRVGHCSILAWTMATYLRQLGHTAFVVEGEISNQEGEGFLRNCTHARVGVVKENGAMMYVDPTELVRTVKGYALSHIENREIQAMERAFDAATSREEKWEGLQQFRRAVDERESCEYESAYRENAFSVDTIDDHEYSLEGMDVTDQDLEIWFEELVRFSPSTLSLTQKKGMNALADLRASYGLALSSQCVSKLEFGVRWNRLFSEDRRALAERQECIPGSTEMILFSEKEVTHLFPEAVDFFYQRSHVTSAKHDEEPVMWRASQDAMLCAVGVVDRKESLLAFCDTHNPHLFAVDGEHSNRETQRHMLFLKLAALALVDEDARRHLKDTFEIGESALCEYAYLFEPSLHQKTKPKKVVTTVREFSGKKGEADYGAFCERVAWMKEEFVVSSQEYPLALRRVQGILARIPLRSEPASRVAWETERDPFETNITPYDETRHDVGMIDERASLIRGQLMVKDAWRLPKKEYVLHIHLDTAFSDAPAGPVGSHYAQVKVLLDAVKIYAKRKQVRVLISSGNNDYFSIIPGQDFSTDMVVFRLLFLRIDRINRGITQTDILKEAGEYGFQTVEGMPKNLLYLSANQGRVNAVKYILGKKTQVTAKTFTEIGLDVFPRLRIPEES